MERGWGFIARALRVTLCGLMWAVLACAADDEAPATSTTAPGLAAENTPTPESTPELVSTGVLESGDTLPAVLMGAGIPGEQARAAVDALVAAKLDMRKLQLGRPWTVQRDAVGNLIHFEYEQALGERYHVDVSPTGVFSGVRETARVEQRLVALSATIRSNLSQAIHEAGEGNALTQRLVDVFQWDLNFYSDTRAGDTIEILYTREYVDGQPSGRYDKVFAARYTGSYVGTREVYLFEGEYFDPKGRFARKNFLTSPLDVLRVTSKFGQRFHPIHKTWKQHTGVDYGAPRGTSVWAVSDGTVIAAVNGGTGYGKHVRIQHANGYETLYAHLSRINVVKGQRVRQKMKIGEVGMTGTATAPHLHFEITVKGKRVDPSRQKMIPGMPIATTKKEAFEAEKQRLMVQLRELQLPAEAAAAIKPEDPWGWYLPVGEGRL